VQSENQGIFAASFNKPEEETCENELQRICEPKFMSYAPMISFNSLKNQSNATIFIRRLKENKDF